MDINYQLKHFADLTTLELYNILRLRQEVFIVEQNCLYLDNDGLDQESLHLCGYLEEELVAYTRLIPIDLTHNGHIVIGRVINAKSIRGNGVGRDLMLRSIEVVQHKWPEVPIKIGAQTYLSEFYESLGFSQVGQEYLEDGIPHIHMILNHSS